MANFNPLGYTGLVIGNTKRIGQAQFDPNDFTVTAGGIVQLSATGAVQTINNLSPTAGNITIAGTANETDVSNAGSTVTIGLPAAVTVTTSVTTASFITSSATLGTTFTANSITPTGTDANISLLVNGKGTGGVVHSRGLVGGDVTIQSTNSDNTNGASNAFFEAATGGASSGDAGIRFQVSGVTNWSMGLDNSDSDAFVISANNSIGTSNAMRIDHASQDVQFLGDFALPAGNMTVSGTITADTVSETITDITFAQSPLLTTNVNTGGAPTGATGDVNLMEVQTGEILEQFILGAGQTIIAPRMTTTGLLTSLDLTNAEGAEYNWGMRANALHTFTVGTSAAFFMELKVSAADIGGLDPFLVGFRKVQANDATLSNYTDFAAIGANATTATDVIVIQDQLNGGGVTATNTTDAWTDGQTKTFRINVDAAGVVTYTIDGSPPTVTNAFTFDNADVVAPFIRHTFNATTPGAINWIQLRVGLQ